MGKIEKYTDENGDEAEFDMIEDGQMFVSTNNQHQVLMTRDNVKHLVEALSKFLEETE